MDEFAIRVRKKSQRNIKLIISLFEMIERMWIFMKEVSRLKPEVSRLEDEVSRLEPKPIFQITLFCLD